jgi:hypothetical protein
MIHLESNQRLHISKDLRGYVDKLIDDGTIPYAVDFLQLGFAHAVREELEPANEFERHTITTSTDILGNTKLVVEAVCQWYARKLQSADPTTKEDLLNLICALAISGGRELKNRWGSRSKLQIQGHVSELSNE